MPPSLTTVVDSLRRPEYTGENRCIPCTVANAFLAILLAVLIATGALSFGSTVATLLGVAVLAVSAVAIYLRGYLVPGTPRLTKTYFPDRVLRKFDKRPALAESAPAVGADETRPEGGEGRSGADEELEVTQGDEATEVAEDRPKEREASEGGGSEDEASATGPDVLDVETFLREGDVLTDDESGEDLRLTDGFRTAWHERIADLRDSDLAATDVTVLVDVDPERLALERAGDLFVVLLDRQEIDQWESRAALVADVAAARELRDRHETWASLDANARSGIVNELRMFLERCPSCDGPVSMGDEVVESCCRSVDVLAATCEECGVRVFEARKVP